MIGVIELTPKTQNRQSVRSRPGRKVAGFRKVHTVAVPVQVRIPQHQINCVQIDVLGFPNVGVAVGGFSKISFHE